MPTPTPVRGSNPTLGQPLPIRLTRLLRAPRTKVFEAWGTADQLRRWFAPDPCTVSDVEVRMQVGGPFVVRMRTSRGEEPCIRGTFVTVEPHSRLVIDMLITDLDRKEFRALTTIELADAPGGTRLDLEQAWSRLDPSKGWMIQDAPQDASEGWRCVLNKLEAESAPRQGEDGVRPVAHASFHLERTYEAPLARVWKALTDPAAKARWFSGTPGQWQLIEHQLDVRVGGTERLQGRWASGVVTTFDAYYHDVIPPARLVYSYTMHVDERKISVSLASIELRTSDSTSPGTTLRITEQGAFLDGYEDAGSREHGTAQLIDALGRSLRD
jgi:uncharacterized protein YndB with AHSA1/START domain